jgi:hypothetical protein
MAIVLCACSRIIDHKILGPVKSGAEPMELSGEEKQFHQTLFIADLHADTLASGGDVATRSTGHVSLARMQEGNVTLQAFTVFTITPGARSNGCIYGDDFNYAALLSIAQLRPPYLWFSPRERAIDQACRLAATSEASDAPGAGPSPCTIKAKGEGGGASGFLLVRTAGDLANLVKRRMD